MADVVEHPSLRLARVFDGFLSDVSARGVADSAVKRGAVGLLILMAEDAGLAGDPRVADLRQLLRESVAPETGAAAS